MKLKLWLLFPVFTFIFIVHISSCWFPVLRPHIDPKKAWEQFYDDSAVADVQCDSYNNVFVLFSNGDIKKYNSRGKEYIDWLKDPTTWPARTMAIDSQNNVFIVGGNDAWHIKKINSDGTEDTENWNKTYGEDFNNGVIISFYHQGHAVGIDNNDDIYVFGSYESYFGFYEYDFAARIIKFSNNGDELQTTHLAIGPPSDNYPWWYGTNNGKYEIATNEAGDVFILSTRVCLSSADFLVMKYDSWQTIYDFTIHSPYFDVSTDHAYSMTVDQSGNIFILTKLIMQYINEKIVKRSIMKFNPDGTHDENWEIILDQEHDDGEIAINKQGAIYYISKSIFKKFDSVTGEEDPAFNNPLGPEDNGYLVTIDNAGDLYIAGSSPNQIDDESGTDWWIKKIIVRK